MVEITNEVLINYIDKKSRMAALEVNRRIIVVDFMLVPTSNGFDVKTEYSCRVANDWNMSNPLTFQAKTIKGLVGQLKRHNYNLVPYQC